jgi:Holliday junction resolvase RusA-like endonuclease
VARTYALRVTVPATMPADIDNCLKALSDLLQEHGVVENDRLYRRLMV